MGSIASFTQFNPVHSANTVNARTQSKASSLWAPLQEFIGFLVAPVARGAQQRSTPQADQTPVRATPARALRLRSELAARPLTCFSARLPADGASPGKAPSRLRILREFEPGASPSAAGRMVISGRMADICDELDRMIRADNRAH